MAEADVVAPTELLSRARAGDASCFCRLMEPEASRLLRQALALCGDRVIAEDLVSETMVGAWQSLARFDGGCRLSTWLYAILLHRFQKQLRRARSRLPSAASFTPHSPELHHADETIARVPDPAETGPDSVARAETEERLRQAVAALPEEHRAVLLLRFFEEASLEEIGAALGIPLGTVKSRLHHGLEKLRRMEVVVNLQAERRDT